MATVDFPWRPTGLTDASIELRTVSKEYRFFDAQKSDDEHSWQYSSSAAGGRFSYLTANMAGLKMHGNEPQDHRNQMFTVEPTGEFEFILNDPFLLPADFPEWTFELAVDNISSSQFDNIFVGRDMESALNNFSPTLSAMLMMEDSSHLRLSEEIGDPGGWFV